MSSLSQFSKPICLSVSLLALTGNPPGGYKKSRSARSWPRQGSQGGDRTRTGDRRAYLLSPWVAPQALLPLSHTATLPLQSEGPPVIPVTWGAFRCAAFPAGGQQGSGRRRLSKPIRPAVQDVGNHSPETSESAPVCGLVCCAEGAYNQDGGRAPDMRGSDHVIRRCSKIAAPRIIAGTTGSACIVGLLSAPSSLQKGQARGNHGTWRTATVPFYQNPCSSNSLQANIGGAR